MQNGIVMLVDVEALLAERRVEDNVYLVDNTKGLGSVSEGTQDLISHVGGVLNPDGSLAAEAVMNWLAFGISAMPPTVPKSFFDRDPGTALFNELLADVKDASEANARARVVARYEDLAHQRRRHFTTIEHGPGRRRRLPARAVNATGKPLAGDTTSAEHMSPVIVGISGPAVENGVLYPAQYGSPDVYSEGWYWSATVDTHKTGLHAYHIQFMVYRPVKENDEVIWKPETYLMEAKVEVTTGIVTNGFTGCAPGILPIVPEPVLASTEA